MIHFLCFVLGSSCNLQNCTLGNAAFSDTLYSINGSNTITFDVIYEKCY